MADIAAGDPDVLVAPAQAIKGKIAFGARRAKRIFNFENYHFQRDRWISFKRIVDWSKGREKAPGYEQIASAIHAGKFDYNGRSQILFMSPGAIESGWREDNSIVNILPGCLRFSAAQFRQLHHSKQDQSILERAYLSRFWIPRATCERWFKSEGYDLPPWLAAGAASPKISLPPKEAPRPISIKDRDEEFDRWRKSWGDKIPSMAQDINHMRGFGVGRDAVLELRKGAPSRPRGRPKTSLEK